MTGRPPRASKVIRFEAGDAQSGLKAIDIAGRPEYRVDPASQDFIRRLVEMRSDVKAEHEVKRGAEDLLAAAGLKATEQAMKATANSAAYGSPIEMNPIEHRKPQKVTVHLPDGSSHQASVARTEHVGKWFHPVIATLVAAGGRLLLAAAMRLVADHGGHYAFCDTDSLFIVATKRGRTVRCRNGGARTANGHEGVRALAWRQVDDIVQRFATLNPYTADTKSILEIEDENYDPDGRQRQIECLAIASKRYGLFTRTEDSRPELITSGGRRKRSEHGLGHLLPPHAPTTEVDGQSWLDEWWTHLIHLELGMEHPEPEWFDSPAVGRLTVTAARDLKIFKTYNADRAYADQIKPWGFLCLAHPAMHERARQDGPRCLIAPFERDPEIRETMLWVDRDDPRRDLHAIHTARHELRTGKVGVLSYRDYFTGYREHPENKVDDPDDGQPCHTWTRGLLRPRHLTAGELVRVGKESNRLADVDPGLNEEADAVIRYPKPTRECRGCTARVAGRRQWCSDACRKRQTRSRASGSEPAEQDPPGAHAAR